MTPPASRSTVLLAAVTALACAAGCGVPGRGAGGHGTGQLAIISSGRLPASNLVALRDAHGHPRVVVYDLETGRELRARALDGPVLADTASVLGAAQAVFAVKRRSGSELVALSLPTLTVRWRRTVPAAVGQLAWQTGVFPDGGDDAHVVVTGADDDSAYRAVLRNDDGGLVAQGRIGVAAEVFAIAGSRDRELVVGTEDATGLHVALASGDQRRWTHDFPRGARFVTFPASDGRGWRATVFDGSHLVRLEAALGGSAVELVPTAETTALACGIEPAGTWAFEDAPAGAGRRRWTVTYDDAGRRTQATGVVAVAAAQNPVVDCADLDHDGRGDLAVHYDAVPGSPAQLVVLHAADPARPLVRRDVASVWDVSGAASDTLIRLVLAGRRVAVGGLLASGGNVPEWQPELAADEKLSGSYLGIDGACARPVIVVRRGGTDYAKGRSCSGAPWTTG